MSIEIILREITQEDLVHINSWRNNPMVINSLGTSFLFINEDIDHKWYQHYLKNREQAVRLTIETKKTSEYIGNVYLTNINSINRSAEFSICIPGTKFKGKGVGSKSSYRMLEHGFNDLNLERIYLTVLETNSHALSLYKKIGFQKEGILRNAVYKCGMYKNLVIMSILKNDFKKED